MKSSGPSKVQPVLAQAAGQSRPVAVGQLPQGGGPHAALQVDVEFHLGQRAEVAHLPMVTVPAA